MEVYKCQKCNTSFSEADKTWDQAVNSGKCPNCRTLLQGFPVALKSATEFEKKEAESILIRRAERTESENKFRNFIFLIWCIALIVGLLTGHLLLVGKGGVAVISYQQEPILFGIVSLMYAAVFICTVRWLWKKYSA